MTWTLFWDMHSGGGLKEKPYEQIYIEAPEEEAKVIFYNRFGHNPERVSCTCCGRDYSIEESESLEQASGFHRGCRMPDTKRDPKTRLYLNNDPVIRYYEANEKIPNGYKVTSSYRHDSYMTVEEYKKQKHILVIPADDIKPKERKGSVPEQGYIWHD